MSTAVVNSEAVNGHEYFCSVTSTLLQECKLGGLHFTWVMVPKLNAVESEVDSKSLGYTRALCGRRKAITVYGKHFRIVDLANFYPDWHSFNISL